ncbi:hypothetical protein HZA87_06370, partial [Candidatus Uhrbacteria bacterium]|nr:hypothetical protein [Candidatus Uhrbacteria bacterium]
GFAVLRSIPPKQRARILPQLEEHLRVLTNLLVRMDDEQNSAAIELLELQRSAWEDIPSDTRKR